MREMWKGSQYDVQSATNERQALGVCMLTMLHQCQKRTKLSLRRHMERVSAQFVENSMQKSKCCLAIQAKKMVTVSFAARLLATNNDFDINTKFRN